MTKFTRTMTDAEIRAAAGVTDSSIPVVRIDSEDVGSPVLIGGQTEYANGEPIVDGPTAKRVEVTRRWIAAQDRSRSEAVAEDGTGGPFPRMEDLRRYAYLTARDTGTSHMAAVKAMRDEPGEVARDLKIDVGLVRKWADAVIAEVAGFEV